MSRKSLLTLIGLGTVLAAFIALWPRPPGRPEAPPPAPATVSEPAEPARSATPVEPSAAPRPKAPAPSQIVAAQPAPAEPAPALLSKPEQLARLREAFRSLAAGDPKIALHAAHQLTNDVERETALLELVTQWKHGELTAPRQRAWAIASLGLEAGLGAELAGTPELAQLWGNELTNSQSRAVAPERRGPAMMEADPAGAVAFAEQLSPDDHRKFITSAFSNWARRDTEAALQQAEQLPDATDRELATLAIRSVAPTGIGVELKMQDDYPVVGRLFPGTPAEQSGQLHPGDRILAVAQGNNVFVDAQSLPGQQLVQAIRGEPGTMIQLRVLPADAPPDSPPRTIALVRGQIKYKP